MNKIRLINAHELFAEFEKAEWYNNADNDIAEELLLNAQTVEAVPVVHAHWIRGENLDRFRCSYCNHVSYTDINPFIFDYCFFCGAKMDERNELNETN